MEKIKVGTLHAKGKFTKWIAESGGVAVWVSPELRVDWGNVFTPLRNTDGSEYGKPHWAYARTEVITDINRFDFATKIKELERVRVALSLRRIGSKIMLTTASSARVKKRLAHWQEQQGSNVVYYFEDGEAVFEKLIFESDANGVALAGKKKEK